MNVLFDLDDTLHDKQASLRRCAMRLMTEFDLENRLDGRSFVDLFIAENCIIQPKDKVFEKIAKKFQLDTNQAFEMKKRFDNSFHEDAQPFPGVVEVLKMLKYSGVQLACVTNGRDFFQRNKISALELEDILDVVVTSGELGIKKPDAAIFLATVQRLGTVLEDCVFCGDNMVADIEPAKNLGMTTIWKSSAEIKPEAADYAFDLFTEFPEIWQAILMDDSKK